MNFIEDGPVNSNIKLLLAHGAGAPMDSDFMNALARLIGGMGIRVIRFEFPYMVLRRQDGKKRPPDRMPKILQSFEEALKCLVSSTPDTEQRIFIGGKSMGGRAASLLAEQIESSGGPAIGGWLALGYPFHPPGKPDKLRTEHLLKTGMPGLAVQGTRDPFGNISEGLDKKIGQSTRIAWVEDGNHDLVPRKRSGRTQEENWLCAAKIASEFMLSAPE